MTDERLPWFKCYPTKLLGALSAMPPNQGYVYWVVCLRIYETGKPCPDTLDALSRRTGLNKRRVSDALEALFKSGKLEQKPEGISNPFAEKVLDDSRQLSQKRKTAAAGAGFLPPEKPEQIQDGVELFADDLLEQTSIDRDSRQADRRKVNNSKRSRIEPSRVIDSEESSYASERGFSENVASLMWEAFKNHHISRGNLMFNWSAAWRTWVNNEIKFKGDPRRPNGSGRNGKVTMTDIAMGRAG